VANSLQTKPALKSVGCERGITGARHTPLERQLTD
jgi:hypothetical protein